MSPPPASTRPSVIAFLTCSPPLAAKSPSFCPPTSWTMSASSAPRMAIIASGEVLLEGAPDETLAALEGQIWSRVVANDDELRALEAQFHVISTHLVGGQHEIRVFAASPRATASMPSLPDSKMSISSISHATRRTDALEDTAMAMFWEFFTFELRFRIKSLSTYVYFLGLVSLLVSLRRVGKLRSRRQQQRQGPAQRPLRQLLQRRWLLPLWHHHHRRHLRDVDPAGFPARHLPDPLHQACSKFAYLGGRWTGSW